MIRRWSLTALFLFASAPCMRKTIAVAESLDLDVVAEGIENIHQLELLREMRCRYGQGYHFARPMTAEDFTAAWLHGLPLPGDA
jgi:EAL domain-containing protein (putative c-di-GMP-specific phosphodiesterase class I)